MSNTRGTGLFSWSPLHPALLHASEAHLRDSATSGVELLEDRDEQALDLREDTLHEDAVENLAEDRAKPGHSGADTRQA